MDKISDFEDLVVYRRAYQVSLTLHQLSLHMPKVEQFSGIADQLRRSSKGVCANIAEGYGKQHISKAEFKRYLSIAIGSANEVRVWLRYCFDLGYMNQVTYEQYVCDYIEIAKMLTGLHKRWQ